MPEGYDEADIRSGLRNGGKILQVFLVMRPTHPEQGPLDAEYVCYVRTSWRRGYKILQTFRHKRDKVYVGSGLSRIVWLLRREFSYSGPLTIYDAGSEDLQRFVGLRQIDHDRPFIEQAEPVHTTPAVSPWGWSTHDLTDDSEEPDKE